MCMFFNRWGCRTLLAICICDDGHACFPDCGDDGRVDDDDYVIMELWMFLIMVMMVMLVFLIMVVMTMHNGLRAPLE